MNTPLLQVEHLEVALAQTSRALLHDVSFSLAPHRCLGVIGESGSGKSLLCRALLWLLNTAFVCRGTMRFADDEPLGFHDAALRRYRGRDISLIPQHPMTAFDPLQPIGKQMVETLCAHLALRPREAKDKAIALLQQVRLENAAKRFDDYPAQLSGGMLQRVTIAIALGLSPLLLIADEPTSAVTQAEIVQLFAELRSRNAMTLLFVSHDLGAIQRLADRVMVMHQGRVVKPMRC
ncbi:ABC transporter ATP-binding protein [Candidatus Symbiopectobacterium sp. 'North America']|uniref:ATP-binding cassette domain-containing protein n=1 Tax=Candidatus Symbiopectobacterium sp. 'North America' TaxID=2794574 RepID=UPI0018CBF154|nr:ABC transporter ATP-binding protein [Candidatus Symbiopectobacterium sp. 'North America']